mgnify:FL=1
MVLAKCGELIVTLPVQLRNEVLNSKQRDAYELRATHNGDPKSTYSIYESQVDKATTCCGYLGFWAFNLGPDRDRLPCLTIHPIPADSSQIITRELILLILMRESHNLKFERVTFRVTFTTACKS